MSNAPLLRDFKIWHIESQIWLHAIKFCSSYAHCAHFCNVTLPIRMQSRPPPSRRHIKCPHFRCKASGENAKCNATTAKKKKKRQPSATAFFSSFSFRICEIAYLEYNCFRLTDRRVPFWPRFISIVNCIHFNEFSMVRMRVCVHVRPLAHHAIVKATVTRVTLFTLSFIPTNPNYNGSTSSDA